MKLLHSIFKSFMAMERHACLFLFLGLSLTLLSMAAVFFFGRDTLWFHLRFSEILTLVISSVLVTMGGAFLLDVVYQREGETADKK